MSGIEFFRSCRGPSDWLPLAGCSLDGNDVSRLILDAYAASPLASGDRKTWKKISRHAYPTKLPNQVVEQAGRGSLKSFRDPIIAIDRGLRFASEQFVAPGTFVDAETFTPKKSQAAENVRVARTIYEPLCAALGWRMTMRDAEGDDAAIVIEVPELSFKFRYRSTTSDPSTARGGAPVYRCGDEAGHNPRAFDLFVASARLVQFPHGLFRLASTNGPPTGIFYDWCTRTPKGVLKMGPIASWDANANMVEARVREQFSAEIVRQEFECLSWGLQDAAFLPADLCLECIDREGRWT